MESNNIMNPGFTHFENTRIFHVLRYIYYVIYIMKQNPFLITGYKSREYFCDSGLESIKIRNVIENQRNITLISAKIMGKTGLNTHVFDHISNDPAHIPVTFS